MEGQMSRFERGPKRGRPSHDLAKSIEPAQQPAIPTSRISRQGQTTYLKAARGASPTRSDVNTTFSHATLPNLQNFGDLSVAPATSRALLKSTISPRHVAHAIEPSQIDATTALPPHPLPNLQNIGDFPGVPEPEFSSNFTFPLQESFETDEYIGDEGLIASVVNTCCDTECTAKSCPSCVSCENSCYSPCKNPEECFSGSCRNQSCVCSPQPICTGHHTPAYDHCEWVGNGENCTATVHSPGQTVQHVTESHIKPQTQVTCEWDSCGISTDVHRLPNHLWSDHEPASYVCLWYDCEQAFSTHEELDAHFKLVHCHMGCHWAGCEMVTTSQTELQNHFSQQHLQFNLVHEHDASATQVLPPSLHQRSTSSESDTSMGLQISPGNSSSADISPATSESNAEERHKSGMAGAKTCMWITNADDGTKCAMVFNDGNELQEHIRSSHILGLKSTELACGWVGCNYSQPTKDKSKLARHAYTHSKYCFGTCKFCKQEFSEKSKLLQHEATHLGEKPYICKECDRRFPTQNALTIHERIHQGVKPLVCGMMVNGKKCEYTCSDPSNMSTHKKKHQPPKFVCTVCEKAFCRSDALKRHMLVHDPKKMAAKKRGFTELDDVAGDYFQGM